MQDLYQALAHSCNVYFYNLGLILGPENLATWAERLGLNRLTDIDLPYEKKGIVPRPQWKRKVFKQAWFPGDTVNFSIGQGYLGATPMELVVALSVFANGGYKVTPYILREVDKMGVHPTGKTYLGFNPANLEAVKKGLAGAVRDPEGTARLLRDVGFAVSGKTGTAQTARGEPHGWFVGFFSYKDKTYTVCVFLEHGHSSYEAVKVTHDFLRLLKEEELL
jgi:penicillin-binding protein 2